METNIFKVGNSNAVRLPKILLNELGFSTGCKISIEKSNGKIVLSKINQKKSMKELLKNYNKTYKCSEVLLDDVSVGKEML